MKIRKSALIGTLAVAVCVTLVSAQTAQKLKDSFVQCAERPAVTGREAPFIEFLRSRLPQGVKAEVDNMGNLIVAVGDGVPQLLVIASVDEPGFVVTDITEEGFLKVTTPGGRPPGPLFFQFHEGHYVDIAAKNAVIRGVVALPSSHLVRGRRESLTLDRFLIDIGARTKQEAVERGIEMLDSLVAVKDIASLAENRVAGPMLSRKFGACALLEALHGYNRKTGKSIVFAWATQSAMSNSGAARLARRFAPKQVLVVGGFQRAAGRSGKDPVEILDSGVLIPDKDSPGATSPMLGAALAAAGGKIKVSPSATAAPPETRLFGANADVAVIAIPVAYPGSLVETIDLGDLQQLIELIKLVAEI
jgi:putative aminopeptidase